MVVMSELPDGWSLTTLEAATKVIRGITFPAIAKESTSTPENICCLRTANIQREVIWNDVYYVNRQYAKRDEQFVRVGDILMSMANSYELVGKVAHVKVVPSLTAFGASLSAVRPTTVIEGRYLFHFLRSERVQAELREGSSQTTNIANISVGRLNAINLPLAPIAEQTRIADQLDTLLVRIQACNDRLDAIPALLKRFRQAVLDAATLGTLTEDWREHRGLAFDWQNVTLQDIADVQGGVTKDAKKQSQTDEEIPYLRVANVQRGYIDLAEVKTIRVPAEKLSHLLLENGDVLFNEGGDLDKLGRGWVWEGQIPRCSFQNHVFRARLRDRSNQPKFVSWWGNSRGLEYFVRSGKQTTNLASINKTMLAALPIKLPSSEEQAEIVRRVETLFKIADRIDAQQAAATPNAQRLTGLTLAKAFRGELVPQDPDDEPAATLLARIAKQRTTTATDPKARQPRQTRIRLAAKETTSMTKSRQDLDVMGKPYLANHLRRLTAPATAEALFKVAELPVADFYKQLAWEVAQGHINDKQTTLEPRHAAG
jgi:type I restriction enzyme, S subunit